MFFGPMPPHFANKLKDLLLREGASAKIFYSEEDVQNLMAGRNDEIVYLLPQYGGPKDLVYIEIKSEDLLIVRGELEKMGFKVGSRKTQDESYVASWMCTKCKRSSPQPGLCPRHKIPMLEFSDWVSFKNAKTRARNRYWRILLYFALIIYIGLFIYDVVTGKGGGFPRMIRGQ
jgi:hypothetical protein